MQSRTNPGRLACGLVLAALGCGMAAAQTAATPLLGPAGIAFDSSGGVYVAEVGRHVVDRFDPATEKFVVVAGNGTEGDAGDGGAATAAELDGPQGIAVDAAGNLYIADARNQRVRRVDAGTGAISTVAGSGLAGFGGDGGAAVTARLSRPVAVAVDGAGNLFVADAGNHRVREVVLGTGVISTVAGNGTEGDSGDGGAATTASLDSPGGIAVDGVGNLWISDTRNHRVRRVVLETGVIEAVAGGLGMPKGISVDAAGTVYVADAAGHQVLRIADGVAAVVAGTGGEGFAGDGGAAVAARLDGPVAAGVSPAGLVTVADTRNQRVRQVDDAGVIRTLAGVGSVGAVSLSGPAVVQYGVGTPMVASVPGGDGTVTLYDVTSGVPVALGGAVLVGGVASFGTGLLGVGAHRLMAAYADGESAVATVMVTPAPVVAASDGAAVAFGQAIPVLTGTLTGVLARDAGAVAVSFSSEAAQGATVGSYPVSAVLAGAAAENYTVSTTGAVVIGKAGTATTLTSSTGSVVSGSGVAFVVKVAPAFQGVPTGTVSFLDGGVGVGSVAVDAGGVAGMTASLGVGSHTVTAVYGGDGNFLGSTSAGVLEVVTPPSGDGADFALNATGGGSQTVVGGAAAAFGFGVTVTNGSLSGPILLAASGLPSGASASFNPALIPPGGAVTSFTMSIQTVKKAASGPVRAAAFVLVAGVMILMGRRRRALGLALGLSLLVGCGDRVAAVGGGTGSAPVSYPITVTGTSTSASGVVLVHSVVVTLVVQ